jgi:hypothetical protein
MPTGGHGLSFTNPRLLLTCRAITGGGTVAVTLPAPLDRKALLAADGSRPTAVMFTPQEIVERATRALAPDLQGRADWQLARIGELRKVGGDQVSNWSNVAGEDGYKAYQRRLLEVLAMPPRYWLGWEIAERLLIWHVFRDLLPAPVQDHVKNNRRARLQPDLETSA